MKIYSITLCLSWKLACSEKLSFDFNRHNLHCIQIPLLTETVNNRWSRRILIVLQFKLCGYKVEEWHILYRGLISYRNKGAKYLFQMFSEHTNLENIKRKIVVMFSIYNSMKKKVIIGFCFELITKIVQKINNYVHNCLINFTYFA